MASSWCDKYDKHFQRDKKIIPFISCHVSLSSRITCYIISNKREGELNKFEGMYRRQTRAPTTANRKQLQNESG